MTLSHALVLTAGLGTRLRPLTGVRAKPAIPVAGDPIVRRIIRQLTAGGVSQITLNLHHLPDTLTAVVGDGSDLGAAVRYSWEQPVILGSAGGPRQALEIVGAETFFLMNGDTLTDVDLPTVEEAHRTSGALVTLALVPNLEPLRYGGVKLGHDGTTVTGFVARGAAAAGSFHFIGVQVVERKAFAAIAAGDVINSIGGCYDALIAHSPGCIRAVVTDAHFWDIGTVSDYWNTSWALLPSQVHTSATARIGASATVTRSIFWDDIEVGESAVVDQCIVTDGVRVTSGANYQRKILIRGADGTTIAAPLEID